jgi:hypothetical protein
LLLLAVVEVDNIMQELEVPLVVQEVLVEVVVVLRMVTQVV